MFDRGLIVAGHHRSGTTVLYDILNHHPDISLTYEFGCYMTVDSTLPRHVRFILGRLVRRRNASIITPPMERSKIKGVELFRNTKFILNYLSQITLQRHSQISAAIITMALKKAIGKGTIVGDKHPDYWYELDKLSENHQLNCLAIFRDPRDMASSVLQKSRGEWARYMPPDTKKASEVAKRWVAMIEKIEACEQKLLLIKYEELVLNPSDIVSRVAAYLGVPSEGFDIYKVNSESVGKYLKGLSQEETNEITTHAGEVMQRYGYNI
jgi:hypothetical protein